MPHVEVTLVKGRSTEQKRKAAERITAAIVEEIGARREDTIPNAVAHTRPVPVLGTASRAGLLPPDVQQGPLGLLRVPAAALSVIEMTFRPDFEGVDSHTHEDHVDVFYVLSGEADFVVGNEVRRAGPGSFLAALPGARHGFSNPGPADLRVLNFHAPDAGFVGRLRS